ncbi:MAG: hypothetical protein ABJB05_04850 [Parafilimonas sp.]
MLFITLFSTSCRNNTKEISTTPAYEVQRNAILNINAEQQNLYQKFSGKSERAKRYKEFCNDSLITITGYGNFLYNALDASNDLVDGYADTIHDMHLKIYDNTAILTGKAKMFYLIDKDTLYEDIWISKVFINLKGQWKMVLRNSGPLGVNYRIPKFIRQKTLLKYEGNYGLPGDVPDTFRIENNHLYQFGLNNLKTLYYALNDSSFFTKDDLGLIIFRSNSKGIITYFDWTLPDGQIIKIPKK